MFDNEQQRQVVLGQKAKEFRSSHLLKMLYRLIKKHVSVSVAEREIEMEHEDRKNKIDEFFTNLKSKVKKENHEEKSKKEIKEKLKDAQEVEMKIEDR